MSPCVIVYDGTLVTELYTPMAELWPVLWPLPADDPKFLILSSFSGLVGRLCIFDGWYGFAEYYFYNSYW